MLFYNTDIDRAKYFIATYDMTSSANLKDAAWALAIGQSVGNPNVRNQWENDELFENHSCVIVGDKAELETQTKGIVKIAFPVINTDWNSDGIAHMLCQLMGGHVDIDIITKCRLIELELPVAVTKNFHGPKFGLTGIREYTKQHNKPLLGAIVKPKTGITPKILLEMVKQMVDGGVDFSVSVDESGCLGEGATENFGIVSADNRLLMPPPERVLAGTTAKRAMGNEIKLSCSPNNLSTAKKEPNPLA